MLLQGGPSPNPDQVAGVLLQGESLHANHALIFGTLQDGRAHEARPRNPDRNRDPDRDPIPSPNL